MLAIAREFPAREENQAEYPQWAELSGLLERLYERKDPDGNAAAEKIEDLFHQLHQRVAELALAKQRLESIGAMLEELASKAVVAGENNLCCRTVGFPEPIWLKLLSIYRTQEEGCAITRELQMLRELAGITADTIVAIENWLGSAGTRESAMDSIWRLTRILQSFGYRLPLENLKWRGQMVRALEESGLGMGSDGTIRVRMPEDKYWQPATGVPVKVILDGLAQPIAG
jgi:hypothetical protein